MPAYEVRNGRNTLSVLAYKKQKGTRMTYTVLVVDDEPATRDLLRLMLQTAGHTIEEASHGQEALEQVAANRPDVVLLDVMMPHMDGITACRRLRQNPATADLPIIMFSAKANWSAIEEGLIAGANEYLTKPISRKDLLQTIEQVVAETAAA
jgi:two-component system response regulator MprA